MTRGIEGRIIFEDDPDRMQVQQRHLAASAKCLCVLPQAGESNFQAPYYFCPRGATG